MFTQDGLGAYQQSQNQAQAASASPHKLILMLLEGLQERLARAKGFMERNQVAEKGETITRCLDILNTLSAVLDADEGTEVTVELDRLYEYCGRRLFEANINNDTAIIDEVSMLIGEILEGWAVLKPERVQVTDEIE